MGKLALASSTIFFLVAVPEDWSVRIHLSPDPLGSSDDLRFQRGARNFPTWRKPDRSVETWVAQCGLVQLWQILSHHSSPENMIPRDNSTLAGQTFVTFKTAREVKGADEGMHGNTCGGSV